MGNKLQEIFNPTPDQRKKQIEFVNQGIQYNLDKVGKDCLTCKHHIWVCPHPYYDYITCKFDKSVELPGGLDERHCCKKYEFMGFVEVE